MRYHCPLCQGVSFDYEIHRARLARIARKGITLNENADPTVRDDFESFISRMVPENQPQYIHTLEGSDEIS